MRFTFALLTMIPIFAQTTPDAASLLAENAESLQRYHSYQLTEDTTMKMGMPGMSMSMPVMTYSTVKQALNPGKSRTEMTMAGMQGTLMISDGENIWFYMPMLKQYTKLPSSDPMHNLTDAMGLSNLPDMKALTANAKVLRSELLEVDGDRRDCWVVESRPEKIALPMQAGGEIQDAVYTLWIDKILGLQLKTSFAGKVKAGAAAPATDMSMVTTTRSMKFDEDLPDSLFVFTPPEGAKETKDLFPGMKTAAGGAPPVASEAAVSAPKIASKSLPGEPEAFIPMLDPIDRVQPVYPPEARNQGLQGMVELLVTVDPSGAVVTTEPLTGREIFRPAAGDAVKKWRFRPVYRDGHPVSTYTKVMVDFFLKSEKPLSAEDFDLGQQMQSTQRIEKLTERFPRSPGQVLADSEDQIAGDGGEKRFYKLNPLPKQALEAGALEKAAAYANELIQSANEYRDDWNYGNAIYEGNMVLGLVALRQDRVAEARHYLLESVKTPGSPQLGSFGPDFTLARELLEKGERDNVLDFLTQAKGFWKTGAEQLDAMIAEVRAGRTF